MQRIIHARLPPITPVSVAGGGPALSYDIFGIAALQVKTRRVNAV